ncbi:fatty acid desaturase [Coraliomargarita sinensis]|uniref:Fatty acid desaturase n=1 Tax=Coraliomargarita sinensis TaxID=2174842 RepID=A0A317ZDP3_9BACT|nr:fatty acid desaturase [Coraliomargarita sinensis]PXA02822.1 fatty acid desaturase [Coraliomargarita sinensis]
MSPRTGKELILATRAYAGENRLRSWTAVLSTLVFLVLALTATYWVPILIFKLCLGLLSGLLMVRMFVIYHDHQHHAILDRSKTAEILMRLWGILIMTPSSIWKHSHNTHHAKNCKLHSIFVGSYPVMTIERYQHSSRIERFNYLAIRHPVTIALGYLTVFVGSMCIGPFISEPAKHRDALYALILHLAIYATVIFCLGWMAALFLLVIPFVVASALGAYLFYSQHNFPTVTYMDEDGWTYEGAALESSSYCRMGAVMNYFTANIGYHHIHHLNSRIPYYRLPEALSGIPELQSAKTTSLKPSEVLRCLRLKLWDVPQQRMVSLAEAR